MEAGKTVRVRDIMTTDVITLAAGATLDDAERSLTLHHVSGAPVLDRGAVVGVVSKSDLVDPRHQSTGEPKPTVRDAMTKVVRAVRPGDPAMLAVRLMANEGVHRAVVVDERGKLAGMITPMDVMRALARGERIQYDDPLYVERTERHADPAMADPARDRDEQYDFVDLTVFTLDD